MLRNLKKLAQDIRDYFQQINSWGEIEFNQKDIDNLLTLDEVEKVEPHSITFRNNLNHVIIPSQYVLYAILIKEFALALKEQFDFLEIYKNKKGQPVASDEISKNELNLDEFDIDLWSKKIGLKIFTESDEKLEGKLLLNGQEGNYRFRSNGDIFSSIVLKLINVPDASSSILGKLIYELTQHKEIYDYLERRFMGSLPFLVSDNQSNRFAIKVFSFLYQYDNLEILKPFFVRNNQEDNVSIQYGEVRLTSIFKVSAELLDDEELKMGGSLRFINEPFCVIDANFYYFSTQWTNGTEGRLDIQTLKTLISEVYETLEIIEIDQKLFLRYKNAPSIKRVLEAKAFDLGLFNMALESSNLRFSKFLKLRLVSSLLSKKFLILTGLSGSGKTKLAQAFAEWISENEDQIALIPVGADWTNREPLLGYVNGLEIGKYVKPESGALDLILSANSNPEKPYFLILDEMNLSHVERYFADFLSVMESGNQIKLHSSETEMSGVPPTLFLPKNLFIIGTVNIDETTYMFSPKVLDRANVIEFRVNDSEIADFLNEPKTINMTALRAEGSNMGANFLELSGNKAFEHEASEEISKVLVSFFKGLSEIGAEFGYRSASEIVRLINQLKVIDDSISIEDCLDIAIMQKLLPKLHGSRRKLVSVLKVLAQLCIKEEIKDIEKVLLAKADFDLQDRKTVSYPISLEKIKRMYKNAIEHGFASYAEA